MSWYIQELNCFSKGLKSKVLSSVHRALFSGDVSTVIRTRNAKQDDGVASLGRQRVLFPLLPNLFSTSCITESNAHCLQLQNISPVRQFSPVLFPSPQPHETFWFEQHYSLLVQLQHKVNANTWQIELQCCSTADLNLLPALCSGNASWGRTWFQSEVAPVISRKQRAPVESH